MKLFILIKRGTIMINNSKQEIINKDSKKDKKLLLKLFFNMLYISAFTFGGGFVIITFMKKIYVDKYHWIDEQEMLDMTALAQSSPGAIAVNAAILVGWHVCGFAGMIVSVLGTIIPPMAILTAISFCYNAFSTNAIIALLLKGMQAGVAAVILDVVCELGLKVAKGKNILHYIIFIVAFIASFVFDINVIFIILATVVVGVIKVLVTKKTDKGDVAKS